MTRLLQTYLLFAVSCLLASCYNDEPWDRGYIDGYAPIYSTDATLKQISFQPPRKTVNGGKLFTAGTNVLQEEIDSGLHVISYQDPAHPVKTGFLRIPGFQVAAIDGDYLYANNYNDLIAIPLKALSANMTVGRVAGIWKQLDYPAGQDVYFECVDPSKGVVIGWRKAKIHNPQCRKPAKWDAYPPDETNHNNAGLVVLHRKLYLASAESLAIYSLSSPGQPVIAKSLESQGSRPDSIFLLNNELALVFARHLYRHDTASLEKTSYYDNLSYCLKVTGIGKTAYAISSQKNLCGGPSSNLIKFRVRADTTGVVELNRLQIGMANAFVIAGNYIYVAEDEGMAIVNIAGATLENAGGLFSGNYSDIVNNGDLLFLHDNKQIVCYSIATSPVSPTLISQLSY
jgi:hypothetical protein